MPKNLHGEKEWKGKEESLNLKAVPEFWTLRMLLNTTQACYWEESNSFSKGNTF